MTERLLGNLINHVKDEEMVEIHVSGEYQLALPTRSKVFIDATGKVTRITDPTPSGIAPCGTLVYLDDKPSRQSSP